MGVYDEYGEIQLKVGPCCLVQYDIGDEVEIPDGVYVGHEGLVVIVEGIFIATFEHITTKWGQEVSTASILDPYNPILQAISEFESRGIK
ncbi:MAG: hypothetical protein H8D67_30975 [Deltaproteobacteria bacterium]|nr:hypothetical protein [Deltaproteobacteria bacterium]